MNRAICASIAIAVSLSALSCLPVSAQENATALDAVQSSETEKSADLNSDASSSKKKGKRKLRLAQSGKDAKAESKDKKAEEKSKEEKSEKKDEKKEAAPKSAKSASSVNIATRLASFTTGVVVGTPIAIVRRTGIEIVQGEHDLIGEADTWYKKLGLILPGGLAVPFGSISGGIGGCVYAVKNAWSGSGDEPFGKESFSLGDIGN